jgi:hypothetical protein
MASFGHLDLINKLLAKGADINAKSIDVPSATLRRFTPSRYLCTHPARAVS